MLNTLGDGIDESGNASRSSRLRIRHVLLPGSETFYDVLCFDGKIRSLCPTKENRYVDEAELSQSGGTLLQMDGLLIPGY